MGAKDSMTALRMAYPGKGRAADHEKSRAAAVFLKCMDCAGGSRAEVSACAITHCALWTFRPYGETTRPDGVVPTVAEYDAACPDANPVAIAALAAARAKKTGAATAAGADDTDEGIHVDRATAEAMATMSRGVAGRNP